MMSYIPSFVQAIVRGVSRARSPSDRVENLIVVACPATRRVGKDSGYTIPDLD